MNGAEVVSKEIKSDQSELDLSELPNGLYLLKLKNSDQIWFEKVYIRH
jgi:hypothetical protein